MTGAASPCSMGGRSSHTSVLLVSTTVTCLCRRKAGQTQTACTERVRCKHAPKARSVPCICGQGSAHFCAWPQAVMMSVPVSLRPLQGAACKVLSK